jgi:hypothetical protein
MTPRDLGQDREKLVALASEFWVRLKSGASVDDANVLTTESEGIVEYWVSAGRAEELLMPMLESHLVEARYAASAFLVRYSQSDRAWQTLMTIGKGRYGFISSSAELLLMNRPR